MMKRMLGIGMAFLAMAAMAAEEPEMQTLLGSKITHGGFGGPVVKFTRANDKLAVMTGGRGAWIINHRLTIGCGGYGIVNQINLPYADPDTGRYLQMGYGGFEIGYIFMPEKLINLSAAILIGGGSAQQRYQAQRKSIYYNCKKSTRKPRPPKETHILYNINPLSSRPSHELLLNPCAFFQQKP